MRIGRAVFIPAIIALGVAGSTVAGSAMVAAAGATHPLMAGAHIHPKGPVANPHIYFHA
jgi:hypothetical protein